MKVHINQIPSKRNYIILKKEFHDFIVLKIMNLGKPIKDVSKKIGVTRTSLTRIIKKHNNRIRINLLLKIKEFFNISLKDIENNVIWIGNNNSYGITNPKLPFKFNTKASVRFLAAICNDGCITNGSKNGNKFSYGRLMYYNNETSLRDSICKDALSIFGEKVFKEFHKRNEYYLVFPSVIRDIIITITNYKGIKSINNPSIPSFIFKDKELIYAWIEQTIADEGHVKHYPSTHRREIVWRRSFNKDLSEYKLIRDERKMLDGIGIKHDLKNIGYYKTKKGVEKIKLQIRLSRKDNILKLSKLIKIPDWKKQRIFEEMVNSYIP